MQCFPAFLSLLIGHMHRVRCLLVRGWLYLSVDGRLLSEPAPLLVEHSTFHTVEGQLHQTLPSVSVREEGSARPYSEQRRTGCHGKGGWLELCGGDESGLHLGIRQDSQYKELCVQIRGV